MIYRLTTVTIAIFFFLFPLFSLPITADSYEYNKMTLLVLTALVLTFLFSLKVIREKRLVIVRSSFDFPLFCLTGTVIISTLFQSPNLAVALTTPLSTTTIIAGFLFYVLLVNILHHLGKSDSPLNPTSLMTILVFAAVLLSLYVIGIYTGVLPKSLFTPAGNLLSTAMFLVIITAYLLSFLANYVLIIRRVKILKEKFVPKDLPTVFIFYTLSLLVITATTIFLVYHLSTDQTPLTLPLSFGWMIFLEILKNPTTLLLGLGGANFLTAFSLAKPISYNLSPFWNVIFTSSSSFLLNLATETGIVTFFLYLLILFAAIKLFRKVSAWHSTSSDQLSDTQSYHSQLPSAEILSTPFPMTDISIYQSKLATANSLAILLSVIVALLMQTFLPSSMSFFILTIILLAQSSEKKVVLDIALSRLRKFTYLLLIPSLVLIGVVSYFGSRAYLAEVYFKKSLDALLNNEGSQAYNFQRRAIELNPYLDRYHLAFSKTNLALANTLAAKGELSDQDKQDIPRLVQQAIDYARSAVVLYRTNVVNWDNLGRTYASLINFASGAQDWAISSYQQKLLLDPINPHNHLVLGGLYLNLKRYPETENQFKQAINLKPDFANGHYNLSLAFREQKKYQEAYRELQTTKTLLAANSPDVQKVEQELVELAKLLPTLETTPSAQPQITGEPQTLEEATSPNALINFPTPSQTWSTLAPTISLPQPPITP